MRNCFHAMKKALQMFVFFKLINIYPPNIKIVNSVYEGYIFGIRHDMSVMFINIDTYVFVIVFIDMTNDCLFERGVSYITLFFILSTYSKTAIKSTILYSYLGINHTLKFFHLASLKSSCHKCTPEAYYSFDKYRDPTLSHNSSNLL